MPGSGGSMAAGEFQELSRNPATLDKFGNTPSLVTMEPSESSGSATAWHVSLVLRELIRSYAILVSQNNKFSIIKYISGR